MFNRKAAEAAPNSSAAALPQGFDDEASPYFIPVWMRSHWPRLAEHTTFDRHDVLTEMRSIALAELRERLLAQYPQLREWETYRASDAYAAAAAAGSTPSKPALAREQSEALHEKVREQIEEFRFQHEDEFKERARHVLRLHHVAEQLSREERHRDALERHHQRYLCPECKHSEPANGEPQKWDLLTGQAPAANSRRPAVGPCCMVCGMLAHTRYLLFHLGSEPLVGTADDAESRAMLADRMIREALGD